MYDSIPQYLKELDNWLCYDARDRASYKGLSKEQIEDNKKAPRDIKGKKASTKKRLYTFNEYLEQLIQKQLITSYKPILKGKEINTYQIIINKNAKI